MSGIATLVRRTGRALRDVVLEPAAEADGAAPKVAAAEPPEAGPSAAAAGPPVVLATAIGGSGGAGTLAAAVGIAAATRERARGVLFVDLEPPARRRGPTMLASEAARALEERVRARSGPYRSAAARGHLCYLPLRGSEDPLRLLTELLGGDAGASAVIVHVPQFIWPQAVADPRIGARSGLIRAELPADRALAALAVRELHARGMRAKVVSRPLGMVASRRALAGIDPTGAASVRAARLSRALLGERPPRRAAGGAGFRAPYL